jgi:hypothetical protein
VCKRSKKGLSKHLLASILIDKEYIEAYPDAWLRLRNDYKMKFPGRWLLYPMGISDSAISHNHSIEAKIELLPLDNRIPRSLDFRDEIEELLRLIFKDSSTQFPTNSQIKDNVDKFTEDIVKIIDPGKPKPDGFQYIDGIKRESEKRRSCLDVGTLRMLKSWQAIFSRSPEVEEQPWNCCGKA